MNPMKIMVKKYVLIVEQNSHLMMHCMDDVFCVALVEKNLSHDHDRKRTEPCWILFVTKSRYT